MDLALPPAFVAGAGALLALVVAALLAAARRALARARERARVRHGHAGERRGRVLLERAGWRVLAAQPAAELTLAVDGEELTRALCADYLCERDGRVLPAEVKTGAGADPASRATRRQLLEYALAYGSGTVLFVDADAGTVREVLFPQGEARAARPRAPLRVGLVVALGGGLAGVLAGYLAWGR